MAVEEQKQKRGTQASHAQQYAIPLGRVTGIIPNCCFWCAGALMCLEPSRYLDEEIPKF